MKAKNDVWKDGLEIGTKAMIASIPVVGGGLSVLLYDGRAKIQQNRLNEFLVDLKTKVEANSQLLSEISEHDEESLITITEMAIDTATQIRTEEKRQMLVNYCLNTLIEPVTKINFVEREYFLESLSEMNDIEISLLTFMQNNPKPIRIAHLQFEGENEIDQFMIFAAASKLVDRGFLTSTQLFVDMPATPEYGKVPDNLEVTSSPVNAQVSQVSSLGRKFVQFCIQEKIDNFSK